MGMCLLLGGPIHHITVRGKDVLFEVHPYCGPHPIHKRTLDPLDNIPPGFWDAIQLWIDGGKKLDGDKCVVPSKCSKCESSGFITRHLGGKHYEVVGKCEVCDGRGWKF
jgi:hypothetical protein